MLIVKMLKNDNSVYVITNYLNMLLLVVSFKIKEAFNEKNHADKERISFQICLMTKIEQFVRCLLASKGSKQINAEI